MKLSKQDLFSDGQTLGTTVADHASTNTLDWAKHGDDDARALTVFAKCDTKGTFGTSGTLTVQFQTSANNSDWTTLLTTDGLTTSTLAAGDFVLNAPLPSGLKRYNRMLYSVGTAAFAVAAKFTSGIVRGQIDKAFSGL